jgi:hypothetical protein
MISGLDGNRGQRCYTRGRAPGNLKTTGPVVRIPLPPPWNLAVIRSVGPVMRGAFLWVGRAMETDVKNRAIGGDVWRRMMALLRVGWPVLLILGILWFPFDWLSEVWPTFGAPFRQVFRNAHDHFVGHTLFFLIIGLLVLAYIPALRRRPQWYLPGLVLAALAQETIQALFRGAAPTYTDLNAFTGDALGGLIAFAVWFTITLFSSRAAP